MIYPRAMTQKEREGLKMIKDSGLAYEIKYVESKYFGGFTVDVPELCANFKMDQSEPFQKALKRYLELGHI